MPKPFMYYNICPIILNYMMNIKHHVWDDVGKDMFVYSF